MLFREYKPIIQLMVNDLRTSINDSDDRKQARLISAGIELEENVSSLSSQSEIHYHAERRLQAIKSRGFALKSFYL
jgi:hypothetical protein